LWNDCIKIFAIFEHSPVSQFVISSLNVEYQQINSRVNNLAALLIHSPCRLIFFCKNLWSEKIKL